MLDYHYTKEQVKYFTQITEYEYKRANPIEPNPTIAPLAVLSFPLPVNMPLDSYQAMIREFEGGEAATAVDLIVRGQNLTSMSEGRGTLGQQQAMTLSEKLTAAGLGATAAFAAIKGTKAIGDLLGLVAGAQQAIDFIGGYAGMTRNPHTSMVFDRMGMRHFDLQFTMSPRDEPQASRLNAMLLYLRQKMHPAFLPNNRFVLQYPSMFSVKFPNMNTMGVPEIGYSFLKDLTINASPQGQVFYKDGRPSFVEVRMQFAELDMKTREAFFGNGTTPTTPGNPNTNPNPGF